MNYTINEIYERIFTKDVKNKITSELLSFGIADVKFDINSYGVCINVSNDESNFTKGRLCKVLNVPENGILSFKNKYVYLPEKDKFLKKKLKL